MAGFSQLQQKEFALQEHGFKAVKHQSFVGTGYFDYVQNTVQQGMASTVAMKDSTVSGSVSLTPVCHGQLVEPWLIETLK